MLVLFDHSQWHKLFFKNPSVQRMWTHRADSSVWTTFRYRHNSLYLQTTGRRKLYDAFTKGSQSIYQRLKQIKENTSIKVKHVNLHSCWSSSLLSRTTDISSVRWVFLPLSFRTPETFCPLSTDTSRTSSQGRTHKLKHIRIKSCSSSAWKNV